MKKVYTLLATVLMSGVLLAQPPKGPVNTGMTFGEKTSVDGAVKSSELAEKLGTEKTMEVVVEGEVVEVCKAEGCWLKIKAADKNIMVKMKDHKFLVPVEMKGKTIAIKGIAENKVTSVEMLKHYAEDANKSKEEIDAIKEPKQEIVIQATGIYVIK
ncbi:MAG: DUF4920 domain-containing protein [Chitinophagaceae bacterium]|nr:DUF4920 domain-containing protein [Chitinophagaceae bacterium]